MKIYLVLGIEKILEVQVYAANLLVNPSGQKQAKVVSSLFNCTGGECFEWRGR